MLSLRVPVSALLAGVTATLAVAASAPIGSMRMALFAVASGMGPLLFIRRRGWSASELLMVPLAASALVWAALAMMPLPAHWVPMLGTAALAVVAWRQGRRMELQLSVLDVPPLLAACLVAVPIAAVFAPHGLRDGSFVAHGWFKLDSFYFFALAQESVERGGWPRENPLLAGVPNYYPSLLHVGLGALAAQGSPIVAMALTQLAPFFLVTSVGLWVVACARAADADSFGAVAAIGIIACVGVAGAVGARPDLFIYPHTQAFAFGWLALLVWIAPRELSDTAATVTAGIVALALVLAHTMTGAAAVLFAGGAALRSGAGRRRLLLAAGVVTLGLTFWRMNAL